MQNILSRIRMLYWILGLGCMLAPMASMGVPFLDNATEYSNQDPTNETRRSDHFRICFGQYNWDNGTYVTEQLVQGNLQMFEQQYHRTVVELGMHDFNVSAFVTHDPAQEVIKYRANFNILMTRNDGGGGGAFMSMDSNGFAYAMANSSSCRYDPPSGATPHEMGHVWEGTAGGFNGTDSSGAWWECTANWMLLQFANTYPQPGAQVGNPMYYPAHGRDYYDTYMIWETALDDARYGAAWVNRIWTDFTPDQQAHEYIIDRMVRCDQSGSPDKTGAARDLWGEMAKRMVTMDYGRQRWLSEANGVDDGSDWNFYQRSRTPLVKLPGASGWFRPERSHIPMEYGYDIIPLTATANTTVNCNFQPQCDYLRQSDWRACLVAVNTNGDAKYSSLWNMGNNYIPLSADDTKLYLVVIATPKPMNTGNAWNAYLTDAGAQFPYAVSFTNTAPKNVIYPVQSHTGMTQHANGGGWKATTAIVDATAYIGPNAQVLNTAQVKGYARIEDYAVVKNSAQVRDYAVVSGHALVEANAKVYGNAKIRDWGHAFGYVEIYENGKVLEHGNCGDGGSATHTKVYGSAVVKGTTYVYDTTTLAGCIMMDGDSANGNGTVASDHGVHFGWGWGADLARFAGLTDNNYIWAQHAFEKDNAAFAMDEYGINHGFMMNASRIAKDTEAPTRGGKVLPLDGVNQYVELHNSVNDFRETAITVWAKWTGTDTDQKIWSMGDGASKTMYLTPSDNGTGKLRFVISDGTTTQALGGLAAVPANTWTHVAVTFASPVFNTTTKKWSATGTLYVDGAQVATLAGMMVPDSLNAPLMENANYLGRGNAGNYFQGYLDDFRVYMKTLTSTEIAAVYAAAAPAAVTVTADTAAPTGLGWLVAPNAISDNAISMSCNAGADASGWVEYYFKCTAGGGHDSGWVSFGKYTDVGLTPNTSYTYIVKMRDRNGNTTADSAAMSAATQASTIGIPTFAYGPKGIAGTTTTNGKIKMVANKASCSSGFAEYKFDQCNSSGVVTKAGTWTSTPTYVDTTLNFNSSYYYVINVRDGRGNTAVSALSSATAAKDQAAPILPIPVAHWAMMPYATIDNKLSMTAQTPTTTDATGVEYYFHCTAGGAPDSAWQTSPTYVSGVLADGTYSFQYKVRDKTARNESGYSTTYSATITPTTGYHNTTMSQLAAMPDDNLVTFTGTVLRVNAKDYYIKDMVSGASITVKPNKGGGWTPPPAVGADPGATDATLALKNVTVKGHLYTINGSRIITYANVTAVGNPITYNISGKVATNTGVGIAGATVYFSDGANPATNPIITATTDASGNYTLGLTNGTWFMAAGASAYNTSATIVQTINGANVPNVNFTLVANARISGKVTKKSDGTAIAGASVYFSTSPGASVSPAFTATTDASGNYSQAVQNGSWYVCAGAANYYTSSDTIASINGVNVANINIGLKSSTRNIPRTADLLFSAVTESLPASGSAGNWATYLPSGQTLSPIGSPTVDSINGMKWVRNLYADGDGFRQATYSAPIAVNGATIVVAVKPIRNTTGTSWTSIVDVFYDRLVLGIRNNTGQVVVRRNGGFDESVTAIADGQTTILTLIMQPDGKYKVWANGALIMDITSTSAMTSLVNGVAGGFANNINVGRNEPDGWTTFNGNIGDVFLYKVALTDVAGTGERQQLEADLYNKFMAYNITATAGTGGTITPSGVTAVDYGNNQTYTITPNTGYSITSVLVDGVAQGAISSYTFSNVLAPHTISATFSAPTLIINASAGTGGTISPSGGVSVTYGTNKTFTMTPSTGYAIGNVMIDDEPYGALSTYTFSNVKMGHTIYVWFVATAKTITASAGANGTVSPSGAVSVNTGASQIFTFSPAAGYGILDVKVDGASITPVNSYTFSNVTTNHTVSATFAKLIGMNNKAALADGKVVGRVIKVWGKIKTDSKPTSFTIEDGSGTPITVNINGAVLPTGFGVDKNVVVTGFMKSDKKLQAQKITIYP